ncbi:lipopolysaccharide ABC export system, permease [Pseudomonas sp. M47T1]|uniref:ABC transporter permease n=1 Tax=Pseudomonas sp. M47T1 TaxID=1179778 RepID=UPI000260803D|nr:ABC transporter permease [Pseudomonas sp. M47T1]EIK95638.1 lipopolysaccharide ABC export system, permease [Pseudomonas sp. M47T1]
MLGMLRGLWQYRSFIGSSIKNEFIARFARSRLGGLWMIIHPLAQVAIYALILSNVLAAKLPGIDNKYAYALYLMAGMLAWNLFSEIVSRCLTIFIENGNLMKKMRFPRIALPVIVVGSCLLNNLLLFVAVLAVFAILGHEPTMQMLWLIPMTLAVVALAVGLGLVLGILNVFLRDIGQVVPIVLQVLFWFTPIVYSVNIIPEGLRGMLIYNPLYPLVVSYQSIMVYGTSPSLQDALFAFTLAFCLMALGLFLFRRAAPEMVDSL